MLVMCSYARTAQMIIFDGFLTQCFPVERKKKKLRNHKTAKLCNSKQMDNNNLLPMAKLKSAHKQLQFSGNYVRY